VIGNLIAKLLFCAGVLKSAQKKFLGFRLAAVLVSLFVSFNAAAIVFGGSNLDLMGYPSHSCNAPYSKPFKPFSFDTQWQVDQYNSEVERYNSELRSYLDCIRKYVENAKNDIERIKEKAHAAVNEANSL